MEAAAIAEAKKIEAEKAGAQIDKKRLETEKADEKKKLEAEIAAAS